MPAGVPEIDLPVLKWSKFHLRTYILLGIVTVVVGACLIYLVFVGNRMAAVHTPLMKAAIEIQAETAMAHVWFEEVMSGDSEACVNIVWTHLDKAEWYATAMLVGGKKPDNKFIAIDKPELNAELQNVLHNLKAFRAIAEERFSIGDNAGIGTELDQRFDLVFDDLMEQTENLEHFLQVYLQAELVQFRTASVVGCLISIILAVVTLLLFRHFEGQRQKRIWDLHKSNLELTAVHEQATAMNEELIHEIEERQKVEDALKESEDHFRVLYENAPLAYQSLDDKGCLIEVNQKWLDLFGRTREEVMGHSIAEFLTPAFQEAVSERFPKFKQAGQIKSLEFDFIHKDGSIVVASVDGRISHHPDGSFRQTHCILTDVTERRAASKEKAKLEWQLRQTQKLEAIGVLAGGIAHDFNNVLFGILGYSDLALDAIPKGHEAEDHLREITKAGNRAADLVKQIMTFARRSDRKVVPVELIPLVKEVAKLIRATLPTSINIKQRILTNTASVVADPTEIHQILMNLCTNAAHAIGESGGVLELELKCTDVDSGMATAYPNLIPGNYVVLSVGDTGHGIPPEILERIFEPFFTTKERGKGTGMGLAVIHSIVADLGGCINVYSEPGKGSTFNVFLPQIATEKTDVPVDDTKLARGNERIMVVDDEPTLVLMLEKMLRGLGYEVSAYSNSVMALAEFREAPENYDLVVTDHEMPSLTGSELALAMLKVDPKKPIILCTGYSRTIEEVKAQKIGIQEFAIKPLSRYSLAQKVRSVLDNNQ